MSSFNCGSKYPICTHTKIGILRTFKTKSKSVFISKQKRNLIIFQSVFQNVCSAGEVVKLK